MDEGRERSATDRVLVVDDDPGVVEMLRGVLRAGGFEVETCSRGENVVERAAEWAPDVILLDIMMPGLDGVSVCRRLRSDYATSGVCIVMLTAKVSAADRLIGLRAGADDYVTKPFDPDELVGRVRAALRRSRERTALSPLTGFPGNTHIHETLKQALLREEPFALMHVDIDGFKAFNDYYNVLRGDRAIRLLGECLHEALKRSEAHRSFLGHVGGDDFTVIIEADGAIPVAEKTIELWDLRAPELYDEEDRERGYIRVRDRLKRTLKFPLVSISIGIATNSHRNFTSHLDAADVAGEMKRVAKRDHFSSFAIDRRKGVPLRHVAAPHDPRSVILVDDAVDMREGLRLHCEYLGFKVVAEARNGVDAVDLAAQYLPAFVVMDERMPRMDGGAAARQIRASVPGVTIVAFSAYLDEKPSWADEFLRKEQVAELTPLLGRLLDERGVEQEAPGAIEPPGARLEEKLPKP